MRFKVIALEAFAMFASYLIFSLSLASATDVNIMYNGQVQDTAKYEQENLVNMNIVVDHEPSDITWTNIKLTVNLNSASLSHSIEKIFLYKCRSSTPTECVRSTPQTFDNYVDTALLWKDMSEKTGSAQYPQAGHLLFIVKLEDTNGKESWAGFFAEVKRTNYNIFDVQQLSLGSVDIYAKSLDLVEPIKAYIENKFMIPFKWAAKVVFNNANPLYGMGANSQEMESHNLQTAVVPVNEITSINKEFYLVAPKISSGIASPITLNLNPSFSCGNGLCESDIGETMGSCCYDCGCPTGQFCDVPANINLSACRNDTSGLSIISATAPSITDCSGGFSAGISVRVANPPVSLGSQIQGTVMLNNTAYTTQCSGGSGSYDCPVTITSQIKCGGGSYVIGPGLMNLTLNYKDGSNTVTKTLSSSFSGVTVSYDCKCQEGSYCDSVKKSCQSEAAITLGITRLTSYLENYQPGDRINLTAKIFNPPAGLVLVDKSATMNLTNGQVSPGTPDCSSPTAQYEYNCLIPFQITNYQNTNAYTFSPNTLYFTITYNDGPLAKTKTISAPFGPVSIPSRTCGDGQCNMDETQDTCCLDCGCSGTGKYCDKVNGCRDVSSVTLSVNSVYPINFTDCRQSHAVYLGVTVNNAPTDLSLDYSAYMQAGIIKGWNFQCQKLSPSMFNCTLVIPPLESEGCSLPYKVVSQNSINMSISFPDGKSKQITRTLSTPFQDIQIIPTFHCGDGKCESDIAENASNCCYDCPCKSSPSFGDNYYCDFDPQTFLGGCLPKSNISLVIDSPTAPVNFDSCEISNSVNVKAHIVNQPKNARPESYYATVNGTSQMMYCNPQSSYQSANFSFNCSLLLPTVYKCSQGQTYTFQPNSFSMLLSFENGKQNTEAQTLTAALPVIAIHQGIRTLYDITQEGIAKMKQRLERTIQIARELMDAIKSCMETVKTLAYLQLVLTIAGAIIGAASSTSTIKTPQGTSSGSFGNAMAGAYIGSTIGNTLMNSYVKMCEFLQAQYKIDLEIQNMEMKMINMEMCMEMYQHQLDIGQCDKSPQSCFTSITSCVTTGTSDLTTSVNNVGTIMSQATAALTSSTAGLGSVYGTVGNTTGWYSGGGTANIQMKCPSGASGLPINGSCCNVFGSATFIQATPPTYACNNKNTLNMVVNYQNSCNVLITEKCDANNVGTFQSKGAWSANVEELLGSDLIKVVKYRFYCYDTEANYFQNPTTRSNYEVKNGDGSTLFYTITLNKNKDSNTQKGVCDCSA